MALGAEELAIRRARDDEVIIREAFERHGHWRFARYLARGYQGTCYKLERKSSTTGAGPTNIAFKISGKLRDLEYWDWKKVHRPSELDEEIEGPAERDDDDFVAPQILKMLQNSSHTAHWIDVSPNPAILDRSINAPAVGWQYMQWLPNGTLKRFQDRWRRQNVPIPNRLLWRLFLCFLRGMCAVVWPESIVAGNMEGPENAFAQVSWLQFDFVNSGNWVFDAFDADVTEFREHSLAPPLVMVDMDCCELESKEIDVSERNNHLGDMLVAARDLMTVLAKIRRWNPNDQYKAPVDLRRAESLDIDLRNILEPSEITRPLMRLNRWFKEATDAVRERDENYYRTKMGIIDGSESDDFILQKIQASILNAHDDVDKKLTL